jgi:hypothetical protein
LFVLFFSLIYTRTLVHTHKRIKSRICRLLSSLLKRLLRLTRGRRRCMQHRTVIGEMYPVGRASDLVICSCVRCLCARRVLCFLRSSVNGEIYSVRRVLRVLLSYLVFHLVTRARKFHNQCATLRTRVFVDAVKEVIECHGLLQWTYVFSAIYAR